MAREQVSMDDVTKWWPVVLPDSLGNAQSDVCRHCNVATVSSSCTNPHYVYNQMNCTASAGSSCSGAYLQSFLMGWIPCDSFQLSEKIVQAFPYFFGIITIFRQPIVASVADHIENTMFHLLLCSSWETSHLCQHYWCGHCKWSCWSCVRMHGPLCWVTWDKFRSADILLWQIPWLILAAVTWSNFWEWLAQTNVASPWSWV
jgi:hypothetical protein